MDKKNGLTPPEDLDGLPPFVSSWPQLYALLIATLVILIALFLFIHDPLRMSYLDWIVLSLTLTFIVAYGIYKSRENSNIDSYLLANKSLPWYHVTLSLMATQASAITFLSAPGQAYTDGMRFVQFYFGLPLAMVVLCITFVPKFNKLKIFTAYEFLEAVLTFAHAR